MQNPRAESRPDLSPDDVVSASAELLARLRARGLCGKSPRVHCVTNAVAQNFTANVLLAFGAVPSMTLSGEEIGAFVGRSDALLINLGTFDRERRAATAIALDTAMRHGLPWVLDPVFVDRAPQRAAYARELIFMKPKAIRLNAAEFAALAQAPNPAKAEAQAQTKAEAEAEGEGVVAYARAYDVTVGLSGATDLIADGSRAMTVGNGDPLMAKVTAMGCAASALVAACLAVEPDAFLATVAAMLMVGIAGEQAAASARGPGSFAVAILDALYGLDETALKTRAKIDRLKAIEVI